MTHTPFRQSDVAAARGACAPIALFAYNRVEHVRAAIESLRNNTEAGWSDLYVFADAARQVGQQPAVDAVRAYLATITGFASITIVHREHNFGLAKSIISGVTQVCASHGRVIVLEDDLVLSPHFLRYMNDGLDCYAEAQQVASIHGYNYPLDVSLPETFFLRGADCWGWATWSRAWQAFEPDAAKLLRQLRDAGLARDFDFEGAGPYMRMLEDFVAGKNDSWAVRWHAATYLRGMLTLYPGRTLVKNIGIDGSGTHSGELDLYKGDLADAPVTVRPLDLAENPAAHAAFQRFFSATHARVSYPHRLARRLRNAVRRVLKP